MKNTIAFVCLLLECIQLIILPLWVFTMKEGIKNETWNEMMSWLQLFLFVYETNSSFNFKNVTILTFVALLIWCWIITLPAALKKDKKEAFDVAFVKDTKWHMFAWFFSQILFVPLIVNIMKTWFCSFQTVLFILFLVLNDVFWVE